MEEKIKILIVEDSKFQAYNLQKILESRSNYQIEIVDNGLKALEMISKERFHIVITDWVMPGIEGPELIKRTREINQSYVYFILLTAKDSHNAIISGIDAGADDFLSKPYNEGELLARIRSGERIIKLEKKLEEKNRMLEAINRRMREDLEAAARFQKSLLPDKSKKIPGIKFDWYYKPSTELAGDIFNIFSIDEDNTAFYLIDVCGHGVSSALMAVTLHREFLPDPETTTLLVEKNKKNGELIIKSPSKVAEILNSQFQIEKNIQHYFTFVYGILNIKTKLLKYVSAGHPGFVHIPKVGKPGVVEGSDFPIGFVEKPDYKERELRLNSGDRIIVYSDGAFETKNSNNTEFGLERLVETLSKSKESDLTTSINHLVEKISEWNASDYFEDDVSILGLEIE